MKSRANAQVTRYNCKVLREWIEYIRKHLDLFMKVNRGALYVSKEFWTVLALLNDFMGVTPVISELVAELRTARYQFIGRDTPIMVARAIHEAIREIDRSKRLDNRLVDRIVSILERGGINSLSPIDKIKLELRSNKLR